MALPKFIWLVGWLIGTAVTLVSFESNFPRGFAISHNTLSGKKLVSVVKCRTENDIVAGAVTLCWLRCCCLGCHQRIEKHWTVPLFVWSRELTCFITAPLCVCVIRGAYLFRNRSAPLFVCLCDQGSLLISWPLLCLCVCVIRGAYLFPNRFSVCVFVWSGELTCFLTVSLFVCLCDQGSLPVS